MTTQPTTSPTADTTTSARETLHHLAHLTATPYIPELHDDEDNTMTAREELLYALEDGGHLDACADRLINGYRAALLREAADRLGQRADWLAGEYADSGISGEGPEAVLGAWRAAERELRRMAAAAPAGAEDGDRRA